MNEQAKAWDAWIKSEDGKKNSDAVTLRTPSMQQYLINRLWHAFQAGYVAAQSAQGKDGKA